MEPSAVVPSLLPLIISTLLAYLIGSFPTGAIVARLYRGVDLTQVGSERTGATNAMRAMGLGAGLIVLGGDFVKGMVAVFVAREITGGDPLGLGLAGLAVVVGHNRSIFLGGRGGRGVVTGLGSLAVVSPWMFAVAAITGCVVAALTRYVSLGSMCGAATAMVLAVVVHVLGNFPPVLTVYVLVTGGFIIASHADNIARLRAGTERRLGEGRA